MKIRFCGATEGVTGSCHLLLTDKHQVLLDCGQFQGSKSQDRLNYEEFPFEPSEVECMILSHAHIDHCGRIPLLVKRGFTGKIYCTKATADLLPIMLRDSGYIHEKEAEWANKKAERKGQPMVEPLYTLEDAENSLKYITPVIYGQRVEINDEMQLCFNDAGHILGSAVEEIWVREGARETKLVFSGDLGMEHRPILEDPTYIENADFVVMESTYGNRLHPENTMSIQSLIQVILRTVQRGGTVVIPSFAVGRTQEMIYELNKIYDNNPELYQELKDVPVYIDSPMANAATEVFRENTAVFDEEAKAYIAKGDDPLEFKNLHFTQSTEESQRLNSESKPKIIISASGMCEAGRIRHHLKHNLWDPKASIVFVGYQAEGTLGRKLIEGAESVNLFGEEIQVKAEIVNLEGFSGHADRDALAKWISNFKTNPTVFLVHGEQDAKHEFAEFVAKEHDIHPIVVEHNSEYDLAAGSAGERVSGGVAFDDELSAEDIAALRNRISKLEASMEDLLMSASTATGSNLNPKSLIKVNNIVRALEENEADLRAALLPDHSDEQ